MKGFLHFFQFVHPLELKLWRLLLMLHIEFFTCCCIGASLRHCLHFCSLAHFCSSSYVQTRIKSWKSLLFWAVSVIFSSFSVIDKTLMSSYILCFEFLEENFSETIGYIGLKFSETTEFVMTFQYSVILFQKLDEGTKSIGQ